MLLVTYRLRGPGLSQGMYEVNEPTAHASQAKTHLPHWGQLKTGQDTWLETTKYDHDIKLEFNSLEQMF